MDNPPKRRCVVAIEPSKRRWIVPIKDDSTVAVLGRQAFFHLSSVFRDITPRGTASRALGVVVGVPHGVARVLKRVGIGRF